MEKVGVEAIISGLSSFLSGMGKMDSAISKLLPGTNLLQNAFGWLGDTINGLIGGALRVLEFTLGNLIADAIETVIAKIGELIRNVIEAGNEFQTMTIRLNGLNLDSATVATEGYSAAMEQAVALTKEQLEWLQTLGAATPFDPSAISNIYTLARSYGFADDAARRLTKNTLEFSAGMGLTSEHLERVIQNFGQMVQRGKITSTEIRDLARGAFLPVNDVLERIVANSDGAFSSVAELQKAISKPGGGVAAQLFIDAFNEMVEQEPRFVGAAGRLGRAFLPATQNVKELATSVFGLNVVKPVLDVLGEKVASMVDHFVTFNEQGDLIKTERWDALVAAATKLGNAITFVLSEVLGLLPSTESLADGMIAGINRFADFILENRSNIVGFFQNVSKVISEQVVPFIVNDLVPAIANFFGWILRQKGPALELFSNMGDFIANKVVPAIQRISDWVNENRHLIDGFFRSLGEIFAKLVSELTNQAVSSEGGLLAAVEAFMRFVTQNEDLIVKLIDAFIQLSITVLMIKATFATVALSVTAAMTVFHAAIKAGLQVVANLFTQFAAWVIGFLGIGSPSRFFINVGLSIGQGLIVGIQQTISQAYSIGVNMINSIANGIRGSVGRLISAARDAAYSAYNAALSALGMHSPSTLFVAIGQNTMTSMAMGIQNAASKAAETMQAATMQVSAAALAGTQNVVNNNSTSNYNLTVNSSAQTEPIVQDYNMLQSLAGV